MQINVNEFGVKYTFQNPYKFLHNRCQIIENIKDDFCFNYYFDLCFVKRYIDINLYSFYSEISLTVF